MEASNGAGDSAALLAWTNRRGTAGLSRPGHATRWSLCQLPQEETWCEDYLPVRPRGHRSRSPGVSGDHGRLLPNSQSDEAVRPTVQLEGDKEHEQKGLGLQRARSRRYPQPRRRLHMTAITPPR